MFWNMVHLVKCCLDMDSGHFHHALYHYTAKAKLLQISLIYFHWLLEWWTKIWVQFKVRYTVFWIVRQILFVVVCSSFKKNIWISGQPKDLHGQYFSGSGWPKQKLYWPNFFIFLQFRDQHVPKSMKSDMTWPDPAQLLHKTPIFVKLKWLFFKAYLDTYNVNIL